MEKVSLRETIIQAGLVALDKAAEQIAISTRSKPQVRRYDRYDILCGHLPELIAVPGPDVELGRDDVGQKINFEFAVFIWVQRVPRENMDKRRDFALDVQTVAVIEALEAPNAFSSACKVVRGAETASFLRSSTSKHPGPWVIMNLEYCRKRGSADESFVPAGALTPPSPTSVPQAPVY